MNQYSLPWLDAMRKTENHFRDNLNKGHNLNQLLLNNRQTQIERHLPKSLACHLQNYPGQ